MPTYIAPQSLPTSSNGVQTDLAIARLADGETVMTVWTDQRADGATRVMGRAVSLLTRHPIGEAFEIGTSGNNAAGAKVEATTDGGFMVAWHEPHSNGSADLLVRRFVPGPVASQSFEGLTEQRLSGNVIAHQYDLGLVGNSALVAAREVLPSGEMRMVGYEFDIRSTNPTPSQHGIQAWTSPGSMGYDISTTPNQIDVGAGTHNVVYAVQQTDIAYIGLWTPAAAVPFMWGQSFGEPGSHRAWIDTPQIFAYELPGLNGGPTRQALAITHQTRTLSPDGQGQAWVVLSANTDLSQGLYGHFQLLPPNVGTWNTTGEGALTITPGMVLSRFASNTSASSASTVFSIATLGSTNAYSPAGSILTEIDYDQTGVAANIYSIANQGFIYDNPFVIPHGLDGQIPLFLAESTANDGDVIILTGDQVTPPPTNGGLFGLPSERRLVIPGFMNNIVSPIDGSVLLDINQSLPYGVSRLTVTATIGINSSLRLGLAQRDTLLTDHTSGNMTGTRPLFLGPRQIGSLSLSGTGEMDSDTGTQELRIELTSPLQGGELTMLLNSIGLIRTGSVNFGTTQTFDVSYELAAPATAPSTSIRATQHVTVTADWSSETVPQWQSAATMLVATPEHVAQGLQIVPTGWINNGNSPGSRINSISISGATRTYGTAPQLTLDADASGFIITANNELQRNGQTIGTILGSASTTVDLQISLPDGVDNATATQLIQAIRYRLPGASANSSDSVLLTVGDLSGRSSSVALGLTIQPAASDWQALPTSRINTLANGDGFVSAGTIAALRGPNDGQFVVAELLDNVARIQRMNADNLPIGAPIQLGAQLPNHWDNTLSVVGLQDGGFAASWVDNTSRSLPDGSYVSEYRLMIRTFDSSGQANGEPRVLYQAQNWEQSVRTVNLTALENGGVMVSAEVGYPNTSVAVQGMPDNAGPWVVYRRLDATGQDIDSSWRGMDAAPSNLQDSLMTLPLGGSGIGLIYRDLTNTGTPEQPTYDTAYRLQKVSQNGSLDGASVGLDIPGYSHIVDAIDHGPSGLVLLTTSTLVTYESGNARFQSRLNLEQFDGNGQAVGAPIEVANWWPQTTQLNPPMGSLAHNADGDIVVLWSEMLTLASGQSLVRVFDANLQPQGPSQTLNSPLGSAAYFGAPSIISLGNDRYAVSWNNQQQSAGSSVPIPRDLQTQLLGSGTDTLGPNPFWINGFYNGAFGQDGPQPGQTVLLDGDGIFEVVQGEHLNVNTTELTVYNRTPLTAEQINGVIAFDQFGISHQGDASGQVGFDGSTLRFGGQAIGQVVTENGVSYDGQAGRELRIQLHAPADTNALHAVLASLNITIGQGLPAPYRQVSVRLQDTDGSQWSQNVAYFGTSVALRVDAGADQALNSDEAFSRTIQIIDNEDAGEQGRRITIDWGDGQTPQVLENQDGRSLQINHAAFSAVGTYTVQITVHDNYGSETAQDTLVLTVQQDSGGAGGGTPGDDMLTGTTGSDTLSGGDGHDSLSGGEGNDTLAGGSGNDVLDGGSGADSMAGGTGDDIYTVDDPADIVTEVAGEGADTVQSSIAYTLPDQVENLTLLPAPVATRTLPEGAVGGAPAPASLSGSGNTLANILRGTDSDNWLDGAAGNDSIYGHGGADVLLGRDGGDLLYGGAGDDWLDGGSGNDFMEGGAGNDRYVVDSPADVISESNDGGQDTVQANGDYVLYANLENLVLTDTATNGSGNATGNWIQGNAVGNWIGGGAGDDAIYGMAGNDSLQGDEGDDLLDGGDGDDELDGGAGTNTMNGGAGNDRYIIRNASDMIFESLDGGTDTVVVHIDNYVPFANTENILLAGSVLSASGNAADNWMEGTGGDNFLGGGDGHDHLFGYAGSDTLYGDDGADTLEGGDGNDTLMGGFGVDTLIGGDGDDTYYVDGPGDIIIDSAGIDTVYSSGNYTLSGGAIENLVIIGMQDVSGNGDAGGNWMRGNAGANAMHGGAGSDYMDGDDGNDALQGGDGDDTLIGGAGTDTLAGNAGTDHYEGGAGGDTYQFSAGDGLDTIMDLDPDNNVIDRLVFGAGIDANDLWMSRDNDKLVISVGGTGSADQITIGWWFGGTLGRLEQIVDGSGRTLDHGQVEALVNALAGSGVTAPTAGAMWTTGQQATLDTAVATIWP